MSNSNFAGGFLVGAVVGGVLGGILGATLVSRKSLSSESDVTNDAKTDERRPGDKPRKRFLGGTPQPDFETTRRGLEDKIAQLNTAIDEARQQLTSPRLESETLPLHMPSDLGQSSHSR